MLRRVAEIEVEMASFSADAKSFLQFVGLRRSVMIYTDLELVFKPMAADGLLLGRHSTGKTSQRQSVKQSSMDIGQCAETGGLLL